MPKPWQHAFAWACSALAENPNCTLKEVQYPMGYRKKGIKSLCGKTVKESAGAHLVFHRARFDHLLTTSRQSQQPCLVQAVASGLHRPDDDDDDDDEDDDDGYYDDGGGDGDDDVDDDDDDDDDDCDDNDIR
jgi:hypothetical protein